MRKLKIAFIWQGIGVHYMGWADGLSAAMQLIQKEHQVKYFDFPLDGIDEFNPDVVLYWEAPCTILGKDRDNYLDVLSLPYKKCILFAGGPIKREWLLGFDMVFVESAINEQELTDLGIPWRRAFGVNTQVMKPQKTLIRYDAFMQATFAEWKRHELFAESVGSAGCVAGRIQEHDRNGLEACRKREVTIFEEQPAEKICELINASYVVLNTASYWGGGQRCTLEAMACGVPVIVMADSPKNVEFVEESRFGLVSQPNSVAIKDAIQQIKSNPPDSKVGVDYIQSKWTEKHYAEALLQGINEI